MDNPFQNVLNDGGVRIAFVGVATILSLFLLAETINLVNNFGRSAAAATDTIVVSGVGRVSLAPDVARVSFTVQNTAPAVVDAQAATTKQANAAIAFVKGQGVADKDVTTLSYDIMPQYSYPNPCSPGVHCPPYIGQSPKITSYQVSESIQVTLRDLTVIGAFMKGLGDLGVQNVSGPSFTLDDTTAGSDMARADAIANAQAQAKLLAGQLGVHLGKIVSFTDSSVGYPSLVYKTNAMDAGSSATPEIPVGQNTYKASVSITYEIR